MPPQLWDPPCLGHRATYTHKNTYINSDCICSLNLIALEVISKDKDGEPDRMTNGEGSKNPWRAENDLSLLWNGDHCHPLLVIPGSQGPCRNDLLLLPSPPRPGSQQGTMERPETPVMKWGIETLLDSSIIHDICSTGTATSHGHTKPRIKTPRLSP